MTYDGGQLSRLHQRRLEIIAFIERLGAANEELLNQREGAQRISHLAVVNCMDRALEELSLAIRECNVVLGATVYMERKR